MPPEKSAAAHDNNNALNNESASPSNSQINEESAQILPIKGKVSPDAEESSFLPPKKIVVSGMRSLSLAQKRVSSCEMGTVFGPNDPMLNAEKFQCVVTYIWRDDYNPKRTYEQSLNAKLMKTEADWDWLNRHIPKRGRHNCRESAICSINYYFYSKDVELVFPHGVN